MDTIQDWQRVKHNYSEAALAILEDRLTAQGLTREREAILFHMNQVLLFQLGHFQASYTLGPSL